MGQSVIWVLQEPEEAASVADCLVVTRPRLKDCELFFGSSLSQWTVAPGPMLRALSPKHVALMEPPDVCHVEAVTGSP